MDRSRSPSVASVASGSSAPSSSGGGGGGGGGGAPDVIRKSTLRKIAQRWTSDAFRKNVGLPTAFTMSTFYAIGTSRGYIVIFDQDEELRSVLGNPQSGADLGPITCLAISPDQSRLVVGHHMGHIGNPE